MMMFEQNTLNEMLLYAAHRIENKVSYLNDLDSHIGDGDHGTTMLRVCHCIDAVLNQPSDNWAKQYDDLGWLIMSQDGGSAGMLIGNFYIGLSEGFKNTVLTPRETALAFRQALLRVQHFSGAKRGDKTMLDALIPAVEALEQAANDGADTTDLFEKASEAANLGAQETKGMKAARGRAKNMGEKSRGYIDPGAASMAMLFESFGLYVVKVSREEEAYHG
ncbi:dihydroxyacetone kinase subunit L [Vibrio astriarenae]|uniref:Dihydroxyacetone kinase subunit L n=1 Tax=Vibrio astriarenae TaxID=1481923 RepID=A0A7Z2YFC1_9VIBR|nr:dihydroxyacetone kinase subunit DhaL [Vibrio astriarenae]QIA65328.1 dihydroxyacetone kinase subunit L [Vibrio astriarenae]